MRVNPRQSNVKSVYKTHIDAIHFRKTDEKRLHGLDEEAEQKLFTEDRVQTLKELAAKPDVYERLSSALAPSIYEHEDIKKVRPKATCYVGNLAITWPKRPTAATPSFLPIGHSAAAFKKKNILSRGEMQKYPNK